MNTQEQEKPSKTRQWQERSECPVASRPMTPAEIVQFRKVLADSYKCGPQFVSYEFEKIQDEKDADRDDCLWLIYRLDCIVKGQPAKRDIFKIKLPIPEEVRKAGEEQRRKQAQQSRKPKAILPAQTTSAANPSDVNAQNIPPVQTATTAQTETTVQIATTAQTATTTPIVSTPIISEPNEPTVNNGPVTAQNVSASAPARRVRRPARKK